MRAAAMTGMDQKIHVTLEERLFHREAIAIGQQRLGPIPEFLDIAEDVIPASAVQAGRVLAQLVQNLIHLEGRWQGLDQDRGLDGAAPDTQLFLGTDEHVIPQSRLEMTLELR